MKILFAGVFKDGSTNVSQRRALERLGHKVDAFDYRLNRSMSGNEHTEVSIVHRSDRCCDLVLLSKCNGIGSWVIDECNKRTKTALWYMDPLNGNFNSELIEKIGKCHFTFCALQKPYEEAKKYSDNVHFVHEGFDSDVDHPMVADTEEKPFDVTFIGNLRGERVKYYTEVGFKNITGRFGTDHARAVGMSKINLNFVENDSGCSDRVYKVLAAKGFLLTQPWPGMEKDFKDGEDLVVFNGIGDLMRKIDKYLVSEIDRKMIAEHGYRTVQRFSRRQWAKKIVNIVEKG